MAACRCSMHVHGEFSRPPHATRADVDAHAALLTRRSPSMMHLHDCSSSSAHCAAHTAATELPSPPGARPAPFRVVAAATPHCNRAVCSRRCCRLLARPNSAAAAAVVSWAVPKAPPARPPLSTLPLLQQPAAGAWPQNPRAAATPLSAHPALRSCTPANARQRIRAAAAQNGLTAADCRCLVLPAVEAQVRAGAACQRHGPAAGPAQARQLLLAVGFGHPGVRQQLRSAGALGWLAVQRLCVYACVIHKTYGTNACVCV